MSTIFFFLLIFLLFYLPYVYVFQKETNHISVGLGLSGMFGVVMLTIVGMFLSFFSFPSWIVWIGMGILLYRAKPLRIGISSKERILLFIVGICVVLQCVVFFGAGKRTSDGYVYPSLHDTMWNISIAKETTKHFPPQHPGMSGEVLKNNHYFYPLLIGTLSKLTGLSVETVYYEYGSYLVSGLFGLSLIAVVSIYSSRLHTQSMAVILGFLSGNLSYLLPLWYGFSYDWKGNSFMADQPFDQIINPYAVLGFAFYLFGTYCLDRLQKKSFESGIWWWSAMLFFGMVYGYKAFGGIIAILSLTCIVAWHMLVHKRIRILVYFVSTLCVFVPTFFLMTDPSSSSLVFAPGWILQEMISSKDKIFLPELINIHAYYTSIGNYLGLAKWYTFELLIYVFGNLGMRIFGLCTLLYMVIFFKKNKRYFDISFFLFISMGISFLIPLLFNLGANAHNVVQFTPYALVILAVMTAVSFETICSYFSFSFYFCIIVTGLFVFLSIPVNIKNMIEKTRGPEDRISFSEMDMYRFIYAHTDEEDVILLDPSQFLEENAPRSAIYVSGITGRRVYLADATFAVQTGKDPSSRVKDIQKYFSNTGTRDRTFLVDRGIHHVLAHKKFIPNTGQFASERMLKMVYENDEMVFFERT